MATYTKILLSGSTNGKCIKLTATSTPGTLIHTAVTGTSSIDEIFVWLTNQDTVARQITIEFGGTTSPDDLICKTILMPPSSPPIPVLTGQVLQNGLVVRCFVETANVILASGYVNRIA